ncbi:hypothetical protein MMC26_004843 [Xylographa opegraphella]|nr:hypothetical protein [Xylographa opegraphella]
MEEKKAHPYSEHDENARAHTASSSTSDHGALADEKLAQRSGSNVANADYAAAIEDNPPNPWGPGYLKLYMFSAIIFLTATMNGRRFSRIRYDGSLMGSINALPSYTAYFGLPPEGNAGTGIIGQMAGALFIWLADWQGRKRVIFIGCLGVIIGTIVVSTATTIPIFTGGRFLLSFFGTFATTAAPLYFLEIAPPQYRGTIAGLYNTTWYMGSIIATFAVYGSHLNLAGMGNLDWRLPLWLQMLCPGITCVGILFCPESPRWLVAKDRHDQARVIITKYHANGDGDHPIVHLEMREMSDSLRAHPMTNWKQYFNLRDLFRTRSRRYRMMLNIAFSWFGQFSGNNVISYYLPYLLKNVGVTNTNTILLLNAVYAITGWIAAIMGARLHDVVGRRKMFLISTAGMILCLSITAGTAAGYVETGSSQASAASIAFIYIFGVTFAIAYTSMQPIYPGEVLTNDMRAKGMGVFQLTSGASGFVNTFAAPVALSNIGYWFYVFFVFFDLFEFAFIYFLFVETKGRTLEELDEVFEAKNPRKASTKLVAARRRTPRVVGDGDGDDKVGDVDGMGGV